MPDAGWYPDPHNPELMRYWDGSAWTGYTRTPEAASPDPPPFVAPPPAGQPVAVYRNPEQLNDIGQWLRQSFRVAWQKLGICFALTVLGLLPLLVVATLVGLALFDLGIVDDQVQGFGGADVALLLAAGLVGLGWLVWFGVVTIAQYRVLYDAHLGRSVGLADALAVGRRNIGRLIVAYLIVYAIGLAAMIVFLAITGALIVAAGSSLGWEQAFERSLPLLNLLSLVTWPLSLWLTVKLAFIPVAAAVAPRDDGLLRISMRASDGRFWAVLGRVLVLSLVVLVVFFPLQIVMVILVAGGAAIGGSGDASIGLFVVIGALFGLVFGLAIYFAQIMQASALSRLYADLGGPSVE